MPYQAQVTYSAFPSVDVIDPTHLTESWETFVLRMRNVQVVDSKSGVSLFCAANFPNGTGRRNLASAGQVAMLVLDIDNSVPVRGPDGKILRDNQNKMVKALIPNPLEPDLVEMMLSSYEYVLVTSHSHSLAWPRFRVVMPLQTPCPANLWDAYAREALSKLGMDIFIDHLDSQLFNASQSYYWPSHPPGAPNRFTYNEGQPLSVILTPEKVAAAMEHAGRRANKHSPFTPAQVERYYLSQIPNLPVGHVQDGEWRTPCVLHDGTNNKLYINSVTGFFKCWSKCRDIPEHKGGQGDIYRFHEIKHNVDFATAKKAVHEIIGGEPGGTMTDVEVAQAITSSTAEQVPLLMEEIKHQPTKVANKLITQLVTTHPELRQEDLKAEYQKDRKVISFNARSSEAAGIEHIKAEVAQKLESGTTDEFGLCLAPDRYVIDQDGVFSVQMMGKGDNPYLARVTPPIADRPIWPSELGHDLATDKMWVDLNWRGSQGQHHHEWLPITSLNSRESVLNLNDAPVSVDNVIQVCGFLRYAKTALKSPIKQITSAVGWVGTGESLRFVLPTDAQVEYVGEPIATEGNLAAWAEPLAALARSGAGSFRTLAVLGLSAASPLVRHTNRRNPVIGLVAESSTGKGKTIDYALSIWSTPGKSTVPAGSSVKGSQDIGMNKPDYPLFVDEMQQLYKRDPLMVEDSIYFMGNGQRRIVATRFGGTRGGERRYGASFWAAEDDVTQALQKGAQNRVVVLHGPPAANETLTDLMGHTSARNYGVAGARIGELLNERYADYVMEVEITAMELIHNRQGLVGDDPYTIAFVQQGLQLLQDATGVVLPIKDLVQWLIRTLNTNRAEAKDYAEETFVYLMETLMSSTWGRDGQHPNALVDLDSYVAFRLDECCDPEHSPFEINPTSNRVVAALKNRGYTERIAAVWATRGWIRKQGKNLKWTRGATRTGPGTMVWRLSKEGLALLGLSITLEEVNNVQAPSV
jgi:hypothetical protein